MRVAQTVLPAMRQRGHGLIVNIGSMAGSVPMPFRSHYAASKAALEIWAWSLRLELQPFGIGVCCVVAGDFQTELSSHGAATFSAATQNHEAPLSQNPDVYSSTNSKAQAKYIRDEVSGRPVAQMAADIERILHSAPDKLRFRYLAGAAVQCTQFAMKRLLSDRMIEKMMTKTYLG